MKRLFSLSNGKAFHGIASRRLPMLRKPPDAIGDAVLVVDPKGTVIYLNKVAETLTGWSSKKAVISRVVTVQNFLGTGAIRLIIA